MTQSVYQCRGRLGKRVQSQSQTWTTGWLTGWCEWSYARKSGNKTELATNQDPIQLTNANAVLNKLAESWHHSAKFSEQICSLSRLAARCISSWFETKQNKTKQNRKEHMLQTIAMCLGPRKQAARAKITWELVARKRARKQLAHLLDWRVVSEQNRFPSANSSAREGKMMTPLTSEYILIKSTAKLSHARVLGRF